ncbi:MAG: PEP-CTERM sorting domain-containing protein [Verrucomicrobiota bacterium]|nr:PEP-CTERM sorting domain-containing protein [Verrucomicrobiota bacterium]
MKKYGILKGLAGAAALAGASQAYGTIVSVTPPANIPGNDPATGSATPTRVFLDLDGNGTNDLQLAYRSFTTNGYAIQQSFVFSLSGQTASSAQGTQFYAYRITAGATIPGTFTFGQSATYLTQVATNVNGTEYGLWNLGDRGFIGFSFRDAANVLDYGYIEIETDPYVSPANPGGLRFFSAAYETSGAPIVAGAVPEPSTLASLALGGVGLAAAAFKRRKKSAVAA